MDGAVESAFVFGDETCSFDRERKKRRSFYAAADCTVIPINHVNNDDEDESPRHIVYAPSVAAIEFLLHTHPGGLRIIVMGVSVYLCLSACIVRKPHGRTSRNFVHVTCSGRGLVLR